MSDWNNFKPVGREQKKESLTSYIVSVISFAILGAVVGWAMAWFLYLKFATSRLGIRIGPTTKKVGLMVRRLSGSARLRGLLSVWELG